MHFDVLQKLPCAYLQVPLARLLLETDSPDGLPPLEKRQSSKQALHPAGGSDASVRQNHPANVRYNMQPLDGSMQHMHSMNVHSRLATMYCTARATTCKFSEYPE